MTPDLFSPLELRDVAAPNRVMVSPMCQYSCEERDGIPTDWHRVHLGSRAVGGAGIVMSEATGVEPRGRISPADTGIWSDEQVEAWQPITEFISGQGAIPAIQLAHAGRKASKTRPWEGSEPVQPADGGWETIGPSGTAWPYDDPAPPHRRMDQEDIADVIEAFRTGAENALTAGFEIAEVHAAHGYLLHEFLSPVTNDRDDEYGGNFENRTRLLREVVAAVRAVWPDGKPVFVRISATDWFDDQDSWTLEQSVRLAGDLAAAGVDLIDVSSGGIAPDSSPTDAGPGYQVPHAERLREETPSSLRVGAVGAITTSQQADELVRNERADLAIVGREHLRDPYFTLRAAAELDALDRVRVPPQYDRAF
ncbi:NADH:flavin oxidoreductase/NADH oxidase [Halorhabdus amylolytica]|uniref:NADH:flavin oxidoreductase/NADH oxidase n=1 Tax=Halorhabdus amylolytica TaxID=2559573 RepID=UPI0010AA1A1D|nr:NADH:flavin oxidoreductase/NADH oxidase [Halorhabdus amylolytica]